jgi:glyoxylase-like metal-dependent hydrolase (beta-lactamase superfamily II)
VLHNWGPAHTAGDQTILVDGRVLFGGDLFETRMFPIVPYFPPADTDVDGSRWITVLNQLIALDPAVVVPGHGEVTDVSLIRDVRDYLDYVRSEAGRLRASGVPAADSAAAIEQGARVRWDNWANPEWIDYAARAFYQASLPAARVLS